MFSILFTPYFLFYFIDFSLWIKFFMCLMGIGMAGVGMNVMHDGNHGSTQDISGSTKLWVVAFIF